MNLDPETHHTTEWVVEWWDNRQWCWTRPCTSLVEARDVQRAQAGRGYTTRIVRVDTTITRTPLHESARR